MSFQSVLLPELKYLYKRRTSPNTQQNLILYIRGSANSNTVMEDTDDNNDV